MKEQMRFFGLLIFSLVIFTSEARLTLGYCLEKAEENYPTVQKYGIIEKITAIELSDVNKMWLPRASVYGQATVQNAVPEFPGALENVLEQMGESMKGMGKAQYKLGADVTQTIWDGGVSAARRESFRAQQRERRASLDVELYSLRQRVESLYFGILLVNQQIRQMQSTLDLLESNLAEMRSLYRNGAAMQSDVDMVEAQMRAVKQQIASAKGSDLKFRRMLEVFIGEPADKDDLEMPDASMPDNMTSNRPELSLFDARKTLNDTRLAAIKASVMPKIGFFASAYYGYPGFDYFSAMRSGNPSFNVMAGVKVSWNISSLYTRKNDISRISLANESVDNDREKFLFESRLAADGQMEEIEAMREVMAEDGRISQLRADVRKAAESQLRNGVIDAVALLSKINDENQAKLTAAYHEIEMLRLINQLRNTLNR